MTLPSLWAGTITVVQLKCRSQTITVADLTGKAVGGHGDNWWQADLVFSTDFICGGGCGLG